MPNLTNLLPADRARSIRRDYFFRLGSTAAILIAALMLLHGVLLVPSYLYLSEELRMRHAELDEVNALIAASEERQTSERVESIATNAQTLISLTSLPSATSAIRGVLALPHSGIRLTGLAVGMPEGAEPRMSISGIAATRESLRRYHDALEALPSVSRADLPLSVYATESELPFTIQLTGIPLP